MLLIVLFLRTICGCVGVGADDAARDLLLVVARVLVLYGMAVGGGW